LLRRYQKLVIGGSPVYKEISIAIADLRRAIKRVGADTAR
jgi:hypothetical protein